MTIDSGDHRSRRALLAAAAGGAAALAASAALPLTAMAADPDDVVKGVANATAATTSINNATLDSTSFAASAQGNGYGVQGTSTVGPGVFAWSVAAPPAELTPELLAYTGVFGSAPTNPDPNFGGTGVWGYSEDLGVYGEGGTGVIGFGGVGVAGISDSTSAGVLALAKSATDLALDVRGKVKFSRSGRSTIGAGKSNIAVTLAGTSSSSRVFAVLHTNCAGRWVTAVVPTTGKFTIYLNGTVASATYVAWFVLN